MAATRPPPEIKVHAPLPLKLNLDVDLFLHPTNWRWIHCLTIPTEKINALNLSRWPYKWIRYAIGVAVGAEGVLSTDPNSLNAVGESAVPVLPAESADLYYHINNEEKQRMFPADPPIGHIGVTSNASTPRRTGFRTQVSARDGNVCVLTGYAALHCEAVHLLSHSKGDTYIEDYTRRRSRDPADIIDNINSVRNGLLLDLHAHSLLGMHLAFLMTPNFAMNTADIDATAPPTERRCTSHLFLDHSTGPAPLLSGSFLMPNTLDHPPAILFDAVYAGVVIEHFGTSAFKDDVAVTWKDAFYPDGVMSAAEASYKETADGQAIATNRTETQVEERNTRREARNRSGAVDVLMAPYIMVPPNELQAVFKEAREKAAAAEQRDVREKVDGWRQTAAV